MDNYRGTIIEESLGDTAVLDMMTIEKTDISEVSESDETPWLKKWSLHRVEIPEERGQAVAEELSRSILGSHGWYADFKNDAWHYIVMKGKVFRVDRKSQEQYDEAREYAIAHGTPEHQARFRVIEE